MSTVASRSLMREAELAMAAAVRADKRLDRALKELRSQCPHEKVVAFDDSGQRGIRVCTSCGLEDHGRWGRYEILNTEFVKRVSTLEAARGSCPFPTSIYKICIGGKDHSRHLVPVRDMAGKTNFCKEHIPGEVCPACQGQGSYRVSYNDGTGDGRWEKCDECDRTGIISSVSA